MAETRIVMPKTAVKGQKVEIKTLVQHVMETGYRRDNEGKLINRNIVEHFVVVYDGEEVIGVDLGPGIAANPYFAFSLTATRSAEVVFTWTDDRGQVTRETRTLTVA